MPLIKYTEYAIIHWILNNKIQEYLKMHELTVIYSQFMNRMSFN